MTALEQASLAALLERRFGDGLIYLQSREDRQLLKKAVQLGLVTADGYVTPRGQRFARTRELEGTAAPSVEEPGERYELLDDTGV